ncbi:alpha/beta hydrolase [Pseudolactococcus yaeyamensis]
MTKKLLKITFWLSSAIIMLIAIIWIVFQLSPKPGAYIFGQMFNRPVKIGDTQAYQTAHKQVDITYDLTYTSKQSKNTYDLYTPKNTDKPLPVLIWVHGGGFVGGDKANMKEFATRITADAHIAVVSMNYELAPNAHYPSQVMQVDELIKHLQQNNKATLNLNTLFLGGDGAGSQIALQYATIQTSASYAKDMAMPTTIPNAIKGVISYSGPVNLKQFAQESANNHIMQFFAKTIAWSLLGEQNWQTSPKLDQGSLVSHVTKNFPPTYITDGNFYSFQTQGIALEKRLKKTICPSH